MPDAVSSSSRISLPAHLSHAEEALHDPLAVHGFG